MMRFLSPRFVMLIRRSSMSSSGETVISVCVPRPRRDGGTRPSLRENGFVGRALFARGLKCRRPELSPLHIADVAECSPAITSRVFLPARDGEALPAAVPPARGGHHDVIPAIRQEMDLRRRILGIGDHAERRFSAAGRGRDSVASPSCG